MGPFTQGIIESTRGLIEKSELNLWKYVMLTNNDAWWREEESTRKVQYDLEIK